MKKILILSLILSSILLTSCGNDKNIEKDNNTKTKIQEKEQIVKEDKEPEIKYNIINISEQSKINYNCDGMENCNVKINFGKYGDFEIGKYDMIEAKGLYNVFYNSKYNIIVASYATNHIGSLTITDSVKINLNTKKITKFEKTLGEKFYFNDIDTIIPMTGKISKSGYEVIYQEQKEIKLGESNKIDDNLSIKGKEFVKKYYKLLGDKKLNDVYKLTSSAKSNIDFEKIKSWYEDIDTVNIIDIKDLGNNEYQITVDIYDNIINNINTHDIYEKNRYSSFGEGYYLKGIKLYTRYTTIKKITQKDGIKKLETIKTNDYKLLSFDGKNETNRPGFSSYTKGIFTYSNMKVSFGKSINKDKFYIKTSFPHDIGFSIEYGNTNDYIYYTLDNELPENVIKLLFSGNKLKNFYSKGYGDLDYYNFNHGISNFIELFEKTSSGMLKNVLYQANFN